jgi:hypothetical protein
MKQRYPKETRSSANKLDREGLSLLIRKPDEAKELLSSAAIMYSHSGVTQMVNLKERLKETRTIHPDTIEDICRDLNKAAGLFALIGKPESAKKEYALAFKAFYTGFLIYLERGNILRAQMYIHRASDAASRAWGENAKFATLTFLNDLQEHGENAKFIKELSVYTQNIHDIGLPEVVSERVAEL